MRRIYMCERPYPLYRTLIKCVKSTEKNDILISNHVDGMEKMYPILKNCGMFENVFFYDDKIYKDFNSYGTEREYSRLATGWIVLLKKLMKYLNLQKQAREIGLPEGLNFDEYDEIFVNDATSTIAFHLFGRKKKVIWVEHAKNGFQKRLNTVFRICFRIMPVLEKIGMLYSLHGTSKYVGEIEVNENRDLIPLIKGKKIREVNIDRILEELTDEERGFIFELYCKAYDVDLEKDATFSIILTAPLYEDGFVKSEDEQIRVYRNMIEKHVRKECRVLIKPHPRDNTDYKMYFPEFMIGVPCMSAEVFNLISGKRLEGVFGINTSTVDAFTNARERKAYVLSELEMFL